MVDPIGRPRFFAMDPASRTYFGAVVGLAIDLGGVDGLTIGGAVLTGADVAVGFSGLSLW